MQKILIVEDEKAISGVLQSILSDELTDYEFVVAEDGLEGYKQIEKEDFTLVVSDIKMPKLSGTELLKQAIQIKEKSQQKIPNDWRIRSFEKNSGDD